MKYAFGSPEWCERLKVAFEEAAASRDAEERELRYTLSEVYLDPPPELNPVNGKLAWHVRFTPTGAEWKPGEADAPDILIVGRYAALAELGRVIVDDEPETRKRMDDMIRAARRAGDLTYTNTLATQPTFTAGVHDIMARITA
jgi:hypothetical protein